MFRSVFALVLGAGLLCLDVSATAVAAAPVAAPAAQPSLEDQFRTSFREGFMAQELGRFVMEAFPDDYRRFEDDVVGSIQKGEFDLGKLERKGLEFSSGILERNIHFEKTAPDAALIAIADTQIAFLETLRRIDVVACHEFGEKGALSEERMLGLDDSVSETSGALTMAHLKAIVAGRDTPVKRKAASDADVQKVIRAFEKLGGDLTWLGGINDGAAESYPAVTRCDQSLLFARATLELSPAVAGRFLAPE